MRIPLPAVVVLLGAGAACLEPVAVRGTGPDALTAEDRVVACRGSACPYGPCGVCAAHDAGVDLNDPSAAAEIYACLKGTLPSCGAYADFNLATDATCTAKNASYCLTLAHADGGSSTLKISCDGGAPVRCTSPSCCGKTYNVTGGPFDGG